MIQALPQTYTNIYIAGVGASAGGLEALHALLAGLPPGPHNLAIIIAQHLSPTYNSQLVSLLNRATHLEVEEARNDMYIESGKIYVTPPDSHIGIQHGKIILIKASATTSPKPSVDNFFYSLAEEKREKAIGIILSGTGTDGARGINAIKLAGGITIVQEPANARYSGMPTAAIETGIVDLVLPVDQIWKELGKVAGMTDFAHLPLTEPGTQPAMQQLFKLLTSRSGTDFSQYKAFSLHRWIEKRLAGLHLANVESYLSYIDTNPSEVEELHDNILISLSSFFRDADAFGELEKQLAALIASRDKGESIRIWTTGCATGEEAYTIAILFHRLLKENINQYSIQIFATDIDEKAIAFARKGIYPQSALQHIPDNIKQEFFISTGTEYELINSVKSMVLFSRHDLTSSPPFLRQDLITCRNLLIYFNNSLQQVVIPLLHHALQPDGLLFLGMSETIGRFTDLFSIVDGKHKIFRKKTGSSLNTYTQPAKHTDDKTLIRPNPGRNLSCQICSKRRSTILLITRMW
jgi:two-component system CheB/CheR fusion protein